MSVVQKLTQLGQIEAPKTIVYIIGLAQAWPANDLMKMIHFSSTMFICMYIIISNVFFLLNPLCTLTPTIMSFMPQSLLYNMSHWVCLSPITCII